MCMWNDIVVFNESIIRIALSLILKEGQKISFSERGGEVCFGVPFVGCLKMKLLNTFQLGHFHQQGQDCFSLGLNMSFSLVRNHFSPTCEKKEWGSGRLSEIYHLSLHLFLGFSISLPLFLFTLLFTYIRFVFIVLTRCCVGNVRNL